MGAVPQGWAERMRAKREAQSPAPASPTAPTGSDEDAPSGDSLPCPVCGAEGDAPCVTASGVEAARPHKARGRL